MMARLCLLIATLLFVLVTAGPVEKRFGVSLPLKRGVSRASGGANIDRRKRSDSSPVVADLRKQLARVKHIYGDGSVLAPSLHKRGISKSINLTDTGKDYTYFTSIQVGTPRKYYSTVHPLYLQIDHVSKRKPSMSRLAREHRRSPNLVQQLIRLILGYWRIFG